MVLCSALEFTMVFIDQIVRATRDSTVNEDLNPICSEAYEKTLKKYHGWMAQQAFWVNYQQFQFA